MKNKFLITGKYYTINEYKFRDVLNIKKVKSKLQRPDLMAIFMNPRNSTPLNGIDDNFEETVAEPDRTQNQIMQVMLNCGFQYCRVLNLSDIRELKSPIFYKKMAELDSKGITHSIFDDARKNDFNKLWVKGVPVIFGFGVHPNLKPLALKAIAVCKVENPFGVQKNKISHSYYHPLPPIYQKQQVWVKEVSNQLLNKNK